MEEIEAPIEAIQEEIHHRAHAAHENSHDKTGWISHVALSSAFFAVFAAIAALLSNHHANESMLEQIQASNQWSYYQAKGIKANLLSTKLEILSSFGKPVASKDQEKVSEYKKEQEDILEKAREKVESSESHLKHHIVLSKSVTFFQVAIGIAAIAILTLRRRFWYVGLSFAAIGLGFLIQGLFL